MLSRHTFIAQDILDDADFGIVEKYILFMTVWPRADGFNQKIRIQLIRKQSLRNLIQALGTDNEQMWMDGFTGGFFKERWLLLQTVAREFQNEQRLNLVQNRNQYICQCELAMVDPVALAKISALEKHAGIAAEV